MRTRDARLIGPDRGDLRGIASPAVSDELYLLAFDHRRSLLTSFFGVRGEPSPEDVERARLLKLVVWHGLARALADGVPAARTGVLVDTTYGRRVIDEARRAEVRIAIPIEESGREWFGFEVPDWRERLDRFDPTWAKVLVRSNPDGDVEANEGQRRALREVSEHCQATGRRFMFELLVPAEPRQLDSVGGDSDRYDRELRPALTVRAITAFQATGIEPDVWKLEGLETREDHEAIAAAARGDGRGDVGYVVLGRGADLATVERWLRTGIGVDGFVGFAVGRSIWWEPCRDFFDAGATDEAADRAVTEIAGRYRRLVDVFGDLAAP